MKKLVMIFFLLSGYIHCENAVLLFYPSFKFAELSGGYPAKIQVEREFDKSKNKYFVKIDNGNEYIEIINEHSQYCPCENGKYTLKECPEIKLPIKNPFIFVEGHLKEIQFIPHE